MKSSAGNMPALFSRNSRQVSVTDIPCTTGLSRSHRTYGGEKEMAEDDDDYKVGYGKPPIATRFKSGQSGNPAGRKKQNSPQTALRPILKQVLEETIKIGGKNYNPLEVSLRNITNKAMKGDLQATKMLLDLQEKHIPEKLARQGGTLVVKRTPDYLREINAYLQQTEARGGEPKEVYTWGDVPEDMLARAKKRFDKDPGS